MANISLLIEFIFILSLINPYYSEICSKVSEDNYKNIKINSPLKFETKKGDEVCLKYQLGKSKNSIGISFLKSNSYTIEVIIYDSYNRIQKDNGIYKTKNDSYIIAKEDLKEIKVNNYQKNVYLIIRETKNYYYSDYIKLFDSEMPFPLKENSPLTIKNFMSNSEYNFAFSSNKSIAITYSSKSKGNKNIEITKDSVSVLNQKDSNDIFFSLESNKLNNSVINIKVTLLNVNKHDQEFSIIYHEQLGEFKEISLQKYKLNYLANNNKSQLFYFYLEMKPGNKSIYTINFKLDYKVKSTKYIEITTNQASKWPDLNTYKFKGNELQYSYDMDSDENLRYYFIPKQNYILIKVEIKQFKDYTAPNYFNISYSGPVENLKISTTSPINMNNKYSPYYVNFKADNSKKYLFYAPYEDYCLLLKGELFKNNAINTKYIVETSDLHEIGNDYNNITAIIFSETKKVDFIFKEYDPVDTVIINKADRIKEPFNQSFTKEKCDGHKKYIIFKYDIEYYSIGQNNFSNYWTTDGKMDVYYKNSIDKNDFFPQIDPNNILEKETLYDSKTHLDLFTINCNSPGTFYIRPLKKIFKETTHDIYINSIKEIETFLGTEIIQLYSPIKDAPSHIYFSVLTFSDNEIKISPDTSGLFKETSINNKNNFFCLEIDTKLYKMDQMAIKLTSNSNNIIEVTENADCDYCIYKKIESNERTKNVKIDNNNFVIFFDKSFTSFTLEINNLQDENVAYGIVDLPSDKISYIPLANIFTNITKNKIKEKIFKLKEDSPTNNDKYKPYKAFIFSVIKYERTNFEVNIEFKFKSNEELLRLILIISLAISLALAISILLVFIIKNKIKKKKLPLLEDLDDNYDKLLD